MALSKHASGKWRVVCFSAPVMAALKRPHWYSPASYMQQLSKTKAYEFVDAITGWRPT